VSPRPQLQPWITHRWISNGKRSDSIGTAPSQKRLARASLVGSFDRAVSSGSLAFAGDAVCYGNSIVLFLFDRFTTAWERYR
jgi:hypothetical protein